MSESALWYVAVLCFVLALAVLITFA